MPRAAHPEEAFAERRAVLECLPGTLHALGLPIVMPKLRANPGKPQPAKYEALVSTARRADGSTKGDAVVARLLLAVNAARRKAAVRLKLVPRPDLEAPAYYFIRNTVLVLGGLVGLEDAAAFARLNNGRNPEWGSVSSPSSSASWGAAKRFSAACRTSGRRYEPRRRQHAGGRAALLIRSSSGGRAIVTAACRAAPHGSSTAPLPSASRSSSAAAAHAARKKPRAKCDRAVQACPAACMAALASDVSSSDRVLGTCARARAAVWHSACPRNPGVSQHQQTGR